MSFVVASQIMLWIALLVLAWCAWRGAPDRRSSSAHRAGGRIVAAPAAETRGPRRPELALSGLDGSIVKIGGVRGGRSQLLLFLSPELRDLRNIVAGAALGSGRRAELVGHCLGQRRRTLTNMRRSCVRRV